MYGALPMEARFKEALVSTALHALIGNVSGPLSPECIISMEYLVEMVLKVRHASPARLIL